ncbi:hypothetical protein C2W58_00521 [Bacillus pumilus]|uniref:Uncharacterized protein n=1 Tax=Bacillus pumilus TaxID=1408 RepID=A0AB34QQK4_BACPU|nr:hypothetical protein B4127_1964 [Bacillus pumilus]RAP17166.1 hypothetical protein C2W58_00521 [Bacillus pumilus]
MITSVQQVDRLGASKYGMIKFARWAFFGLTFREVSGKQTHEKNKTSIGFYMDA